MSVSCFILSSQTDFISIISYAYRENERHMLSPNASSDIPSEKPKSHRMYDNRFLRVRKQVSHLGSVFLSSLLSWQKTWADRTDRNNKQSLAHGVRVCSPGLLGHVVFDPEEQEAHCAMKVPIAEAGSKEGDRKTSSARAPLPSTKFHLLRFCCLKHGHKL